MDTESAQSMTWEEARLKLLTAAPEDFIILRLVRDMDRNHLPPGTAWSLGESSTLFVDAILSKLHQEDVTNHEVEVLLDENHRLYESEVALDAITNTLRTTLSHTGDASASELLAYLIGVASRDQAIVERYLQQHAEQDGSDAG